MPKRQHKNLDPERASAAEAANGADASSDAAVEEKPEGEAAVESAQRQAQRLQEELIQAEARVKELEDKYLRALADLDNVRRRARQERANALRDGEAQILLEVLPVLDNFARAMAAAQGANNVRALMEGVKLSYDQLHAALARKGVRPIEAEGKPFDPLYHDAIGQLETTDQPEGAVAVEIQKGYMLGDRVLRPSRVMVATRPASGGSAKRPGEVS